MFIDNQGHQYLELIYICFTNLNFCFKLRITRDGMYKNKAQFLVFLLILFPFSATKFIVTLQIQITCPKLNTNINILIIYYYVIFLNCGTVEILLYFNISG